MKLIAADKLVADAIESFAEVIRHLGDARRFIQREAAESYDQEPRT